MNSTDTRNRGLANNKLYMAQSEKDIVHTLQLIRHKVNVLLEQNRLLQDRLHHAEIQIQELRSALETEKNKLEQVADQNKIAKLADALIHDEHDRQEVKIKLNAYIRDIDACIRLLSES